jgi:alanyl-tRNA synthetase
MRALCDQQRQKGAGALLIGGAEDGKVTLIAMVSDELVRSQGFKAGDWVKVAAGVVGGGGGGRPTLAQAGGKQPEKLDDALAEAQRWATQKLGR